MATETRICRMCGKEIEIHAAGIMKRHADKDGTGFCKPQEATSEDIRRVNQTLDLKRKYFGGPKRLVY